MPENNQVMMEILQEVKTIREYLNEQSSNTNQNQWLDNVDVQELLHASAKTIQRLRTSGLLKYSKIKGKLYYNLSDIHAMLEENQVPTTPNLKH